MNVTKIFGYIFIVSALLANSSCLNRQFIEGKSELVSVADTMLTDSAIFVGYAHWLDSPVNYKFQGPFEIWIDNGTKRSTSDSAGYYSIKTIPGTYTIKCQSIGNEWPQLIVGRANIIIEKNSKIRIDFYIGTSVE
jgi:hypothetical protein